MEEIKIVSRWNNKTILVCGKCESIKDCLEKNRGADIRGADIRGADIRGAYLREANLHGANLHGANLRGAYLSDAYLSDANLSGANLRGAYLSDAYLSDANLSGADLRGAYLRSADLRDADLSGANLSGAYLREANLLGADIRDAKNYTQSHDFAIEIIRRKPIDFFTAEEWSDIGKLTVHRFCWQEIKKLATLKSVIKKLSDLGLKEYEKFLDEDNNPKE